jgi:hypothetical protein
LIPGSEGDDILVNGRFLESAEYVSDQAGVGIE